MDLVVERRTLRGAALHLYAASASVLPPFRRAYGRHCEHVVKVGVDELLRLRQEVVQQEVDLPAASSISISLPRLVPLEGRRRRDLEISSEGGRAPAVVEVRTEVETALADGGPTGRAGEGIG